MCISKNWGAGNQLSCTTESYLLNRYKIYTCAYSYSEILHIQAVQTAILFLAIFFNIIVIMFVKFESN